MKLKCVIIFLIICFWGLRPCYSQSYGLGFSGNEVVQDKRTGLDLSPNGELCFDKNFELSFDLSFLPNYTNYFGYVVRIIENNKQNIDLMYNRRIEVAQHFQIIIGDKLSNIVFNIDQDQLFKSWHNIRLKFNNNVLTLYSGNQSFSHRVTLAKGSCFKILFGANNYSDFRTTDVPPMKIRNVKIIAGNKLKYQLPLDESDGTKAKELINKRNAEVTNPRWIKKMHHDWQFLKTLKVTGYANVSFDQVKGDIHVITTDSVLSYSIPYAQTYVHRYASGKQFLIIDNQSFFDTIDKRLYNIYVDQRAVLGFNFQDKRWDGGFSEEPFNHTNYNIFNKFYSSADSSLYIIGGYGHFSYKNDVQRYHFPTKTWKMIKTSGDFFMPRYLSALGHSKNGAYILGGYGSFTGEQVLNPKNLYDLLYFDIKTRKFKKVYEIQRKSDDFVFANSMIIDEKSRTYYALVFPKYKYNSALQLIKGSLDKSVFEEFGNKIPYRFDDAASFSDLFYCPGSKKLIAVTLFHDANDQTKINIYSLLTPPVSIKQEPQKNGLNLLYLFCIVLVASAGESAFFFHQHKKISLQPVSDLKSIALDVATVVNDKKSKQIDERSDFKNAIFLFGDFRLYDSEGYDLTKYFTPIVKELFLLVLVYTIQSGRGISSDEINELLWSDKSKDSARNNRSVNVLKLKKILDRMSYCQISKEADYWKIKIDYQRISLDYKDYLTIVTDKKKLDKQKVIKLAEIIQRGSFLSGTEYEWLDNFKSEISDVIIDTYLYFANSISISSDPELLVQLATCIFYFDPINEEALIIKCKALTHLKRHLSAKSAYDNFCKEYKIMYGEEFTKNFQTILK